MTKEEEQLLKFVEALKEFSKGLKKFRKGLEKLKTKEECPNGKGAVLKTV